MVYIFLDEMFFIFLSSNPCRLLVLGPLNLKNNTAVFQYSST